MRVYPLAGAQLLRYQYQSGLTYWAMLHDDGNVVDQNDDRHTSLADVMAQVGAFALDEGSADAALLLDLPAGAYTLSGGEGVVRLAIYLVE